MRVVHDTPYSVCGWTALVSGLGTIVHPAPLHCSTRVWVVYLVSPAPTATQNVAVTHESPYRSLSLEGSVF